MSLSKFPHSLPPVISPFWQRFPLLGPFDNRLHPRSRQVLVTKHLLDDFQNFLKLSLAVVSDPRKSHISPTMENGWGKGKKMNGGPATADLVAGERGGGPEAKQSAKGLSLKYFIHATSPCNIAPNIHIVWVKCQFTSYIWAILNSVGGLWQCYRSRQF